MPLVGKHVPDDYAKHKVEDHKSYVFQFHQRGRQRARRIDRKIPARTMPLGVIEGSIKKRGEARTWACYGVPIRYHLEADSPDKTPTDRVDKFLFDDSWHRLNRTWQFLVELLVVTCFDSALS